MVHVLFFMVYGFHGLMDVLWASVYSLFDLGLLVFLLCVGCR